MQFFLNTVKPWLFESTNVGARTYSIDCTPHFFPLLGSWFCIHLKLNFLSKAWEVNVQWMKNCLSMWQSIHFAPTFDFEKKPQITTFCLHNHIAPRVINTKSVHVPNGFLCCNKCWYAPVVRCKHSSQSQRTQVCVMKFSLITTILSARLFSCQYILLKYMVC